MAFEASVLNNDQSAAKLNISHLMVLIDVLLSINQNLTKLTKKI